MGMENVRRSLGGGWESTEGAVRNFWAGVFSRSARKGELRSVVERVFSIMAFLTAPTRFFGRSFKCIILSSYSDEHRRSCAVPTDIHRIRHVH